MIHLVSISRVLLFQTKTGTNLAMGRSFWLGIAYICRIHLLSVQANSFYQSTYLYYHRIILPDYVH